MSPNRKIKVAFFADILVKDFDGASRTMFQIIERIPKDKFDFLFFCGIEPLEDIGFEVFKVPSIPIPFNSTYKLALPKMNLLSLTRRLKEFNPDVIHIASPSPLGNFAFKFKKNRNIPVITIYHTHFLSYIEYYLKKLPFLVSPATKTIAASQKKFYDKSDMMYIPTMQIVKELNGFKFDTKKMKIWQRGINHDLFNPTKKDIPFVKLITGNDKPNVIFASRLVWEKNLATLIKVYQKNLDSGNKYNFIIAGDGVAKEKLQSKIPGAYLLGKVDHDTLAKLYASSDVFLFTSISETYGNVVVEAMASGCPCVIAEGGGSQSLVEHGVTGFLCEPNNADDYFSKIEEVISNPKLATTFIENGLSYTETLNWESLVETYFEDITALASRNKDKS